MTGPKGNSKLCFPKTLTVTRGKAEGSIKAEGKQNSLFPVGKNCETKICSTPTGSQISWDFKECKLITTPFPSVRNCKLGSVTRGEGGLNYSELTEGSLRKPW